MTSGQQVGLGFAIHPRIAKLGTKFYWLSTHISFDHKVVHGILRKSFQAYLAPGTLLTVDEARIPCKDKACDFIIFNPKKPHRWAMESLTLSTETKYLWDFTEPHTI
jgi:hypothetical protein